MKRLLSALLILCLLLSIVGCAASDVSLQTRPEDITQTGTTEPLFWPPLPLETEQTTASTEDTQLPEQPGQSKPVDTKPTDPKPTTNPTGDATDATYYPREDEEDPTRPEILPSTPTQPDESRPADHDDTRPTEDRPGQTQPVETQPVQTRPTQPAETQPTQTRPTQPVETQPPQTQPIETQPAQTQPTETQPPQTQPTETQPPQTQPTETQPPQTQPTTEPETEPPTTQAPAPGLDPNGSYDSKWDVALFLVTYGRLPNNYITKRQARGLGWSSGSVERFAPGKCIGGDRFYNNEGLLPDQYVYYECDIGTLGAGSRGRQRLVYTKTGIVYYTSNHYQSFTLLYGDP